MALRRRDGGLQRRKMRGVELGRMGLQTINVPLAKGRTLTDGVERRIAAGTAGGPAHAARHAARTRRACSPAMRGMTVATAGAVVPRRRAERRQVTEESAWMKDKALRRRARAGARSPRQMVEKFDLPDTGKAVRC